ncbi:hypothetical protein C5167_024055 [Papaver somniferum]|uniref:MATH domain-containing protein n=1 Tax=Papaver somniferum TaxID=3469 RepID=A0A4Y7JNI9_PAPSO|nr:hypothetical protein C5167_024055 [Papaver somniferum]
MFRFTKDENVWGFDEFIKLEELKDPSNGYIVNDACIVEVQFCLDSIQDFKEEVLPMELMESVEERDLVAMSTQKCDSHRKLDGNIDKQLVDKVSVAKVQETTANTDTLLAYTSICLDNNSAFICAFCQTSTVSKGSGSMLHIANGKEVIDNEVSAGPNVEHVHRKCTEWAPQVYYVGKTVKNLELELARVAGGMVGEQTLWIGLGSNSRNAVDEQGNEEYDLQGDVEVEEDHENYMEEDEVPVQVRDPKKTTKPSPKGKHIPQEDKLIPIPKDGVIPGLPKDGGNVLFAYQYSYAAKIYPSKAESKTFETPVIEGLAIESGM